MSSCCWELRLQNNNSRLEEKTSLSAPPPSCRPHVLSSNSLAFSDWPKEVPAQPIVALLPPQSTHAYQLHWFHGPLDIPPCHFFSHSNESMGGPLVTLIRSVIRGREILIPAKAIVFYYKWEKYP